VWTVLIAIPHSYQYVVSPKIPYYWHFFIVFLSFSFLFLKSFAIKRLPMPLLIVCSNLQLVFGLLVGKGLFKKSFSFGQYIGVVTITLGCILITLSSQSSTSSDKSPSDIFYGICFIMASITAVAVMIPTGSMLVQKYNADVQEQIFLQHFLSLPLFALQWDRLSPCLWRVLHATEVYSIGGLSLPVVVVLLFSTTVFAQINRYLSMDISLTLSPLASQLINAVNKTFVLLVSMLHFNAPPYPTTLVWLGVVIQTIGSVAYVQSSYSDKSDGNFKPNKRKSRFSRVSWTGSRIMNLSEKDIKHLRAVADASGRNRARRVTEDFFIPSRHLDGVDSSSDCRVPDVKTRRPAFSSATDFKKYN
jgi:drug/metabolite transporter (DMT)-like permease